MRRLYESQKPTPDFARLHEELQRHPHLTLQLAWEEYRQEKARPRLPAQTSRCPDIEGKLPGIQVDRNQRQILDQVAAGGAVRLDRDLEFFGELLEARVPGEVMMVSLSRP